LLQAPGVIDATIFGDKLHVLLHDADAVAGLQPLLTQQSIESGPPRAITPSLEDVFVQLVTRPAA
jgi:ABC-2 type transport system ATP-binding protein